MKYLQCPSAFGAPVISAQIKAQPEDFVVREWLGFEADNEGDHVLLTVRKRDANTMWVAKQLARAAGCDARDVGFAGLKDRHAITEQAFTLPSRQRTPNEWLSCGGEGYEVIAAAKQRRKLKRGAHKGNDFDIVLRQVQGDRVALQQRLQQIATLGVPNYFGPQRFGHYGGNLTRAEQWLLQGESLDDRHQRSFALSAARSYLFNEVLARRVQLGNWNQLLQGERANLNGSNSVFSVQAVDDTLRQRCLEFDIHPTAPLWGQGELAVSDEVLALEREVISHHAALADALAAQSLQQERRATRQWVRDLHWDLQDDQLKLSFRLHRGGFATSVLAELVGMSAITLMEGDE